MRWFGHVERMGDGNLVKRIRIMYIEGVFTRLRIKKTWNKVIQRDLRNVGSNREASRNQVTWRPPLGKYGLYMQAC